MSTKVVSGILLKAGDGQEPMPVPVTDHLSIQQYVGGHFDVVTETYRASEFLLESDDEFVAVGYCHDEGILLNMPLNKLATMVFRRELRGDVVIVSGTSPDGKYDGDNHEMPEWFSQEVFGGRLSEAVTQADERAHFVSDALRRCHDEGLMDGDMLDAIQHVMILGVGGGVLSDDEIQLVNEVLAMATKYHMARLMGMPKFTDEQIKMVDDLTEMMDTEWNVSDEALAKFLEENGGN